MFTEKMFLKVSSFFSWVSTHVTNPGTTILEATEMIQHIGLANLLVSVWSHLDIMCMSDIAYQNSCFYLIMSATMKRNKVLG